MKKLFTLILIGAACALPSLSFADGITLKASLNPVISVDASGKAVLDRASGTANDRFTAEVEISKGDFDVLNITPENGYSDEVVELRVLRDGVQVFKTLLRFSENRPGDITFETDIRGVAAPELRAGDVARLTVNGQFTLRGKFRL